MGKTREPPLVILLDVLFVFLFISVLEKPAKIKYELPPDKLFSGGHIMSVDELKNRKLFDVENNRFVDDFNLPKGEDFYFTQPCENQYECKRARQLTNDDLKIVISGETYNDISKWMFIGCNIDSSACSNITFPVNKYGEVNRTELYNLNPLFGDIDGF